MQFQTGEPSELDVGLRELSPVRSWDHARVASSTEGLGAEGSAWGGGDRREEGICRGLPRIRR